MLIDGTPQKDAVEEAENIFYQINLNKHADYLYIATTASRGDVSFYVTFADYTSPEDEIMFPSSDDNVKEGKHLGHSRVAHFTKNEVAKHCEDFIECRAIITVKGKEAVEFNEFSLVAYTHVPRLVPNIPMVGRIMEKEMMYYTYTSSCEKCSIILSASAYSVDADLDLYINVGYDKELPTPEKHNIKSQEWFNEVIEINTHHKYFKDNNIKTMNKVFIIGVYSKQDTTFSIEIEDTESEVKGIRRGHSVHVDLEPNSMKFYYYKHDEKHGVKFELTMMSGSADMLVNTYKLRDNFEPEHKFLPQNDKTSIWRTNSRESTSIKIPVDHEHFCTNCVYLIGIQSNIGGAKFALEVQEDKIGSTKQVRLGVPIKDSIEKDDQKQYVFVLDRKMKFRINASVYLGHIKYSIGDHENFSKAIKSSHDSFIEIDGKDLNHFEEGQNVYIKVKGEFEHSEFILLVTHHDSYSVIPDSFPQEFTINPFDSTGINLVYYPPSSEFELKMQVNTLSGGIKYDVYLKQVFLKEIVGSTLAFPTSKDTEFFQKGWNNQKMYFSKNMNVNTETDDEFIYLVTLVPVVIFEDSLTDREKVKLTVQMNSHSISILSPNIEVEDYIIASGQEYKYYKFFANGQINMDIVLTPCVCDHEVFVFKTHQDALSKKNAIDRSRVMVNGEKRVNIKNASGPYYLRVENLRKEDAKYIKPKQYCVFTLQFIDRDNPNFKYSVEDYVPGEKGQIQYKFEPNNKLKLTWNKIQKVGGSKNEEYDGISSVYWLKKPNVFMNSVCGISHAVKRKEAVELSARIEKQKVVIDFNKHKNILKHDYATFTLIGYVGRDGGGIPYTPIIIDLKRSWLSMIPWWAYLFFILLVGGLVFAVYRLTRKIKRVQSKLDFEMNDIRNVARVGYADDSVEQERINV